MKNSETNIPNVLIVGDIQTAFSDAQDLLQTNCRIATGMFDAIEIATQTEFQAIAVVISGLSAGLNASLKALRQASGRSDIILLAQMSEEPQARKLTSPSCNGSRIANDYLICPISIQTFHNAISQSSVEEATDFEVAGIRYDPQKIHKLEQLATIDELTGLKNRRYILEFTRQMLNHARKEHGRVTLLLFDIDNFKHYNDVYSHAVGDEILRQAAVLMKRCCRPHDVVGRIGGDEFVVIFCGDRKHKTTTDSERRGAEADHPKEAMFIASRFRRELSRAELNFLGPEGKGVLTISGGLASFPLDGSDVQQLFAQADKALLEAKRSGKNRIYIVGKSDSDIDAI